MEIRLDGKTALVTGASSGLGRRFATVLAHAGARVALAARRTERLAALAREIESTGGAAYAVAMDVTDVRVGACRRRGGRERARADRCPGEQLSRQRHQAPRGGRGGRLRPGHGHQRQGMFFVTQAVGKSMIAGKRPGRIVNIASVAGLRVLGQLSVYGMSKAAVVQLTRSLALEWGRHGINANTLCPGYIETEINRDYWDTDGGRKLVAMLPRRRVGKPEDLDALVLLLCSDASGFVNGAVIAADDGLAIS
jgi:NAD(P)-dependent dehydrogenase (short-subunit alcohol dehydrogenase family)